MMKRRSGRVFVVRTICRSGIHKRAEACLYHGYAVEGMTFCASEFERLTGLCLKPGESARVRLVRVGRGKGRK